MCTVILAFRAFDDTPLKIAANRDERLDRPAETFQIRDTRPTILAPRDLRAGGTWIGLNEHGLVAAITNRYASTVEDPAHSRGELVTAALGASDLERAADTILALEANDFSGFHLTIATVDGAITIWSDTRKLHRVDRGPGIHVVTERSFGAAESPREEWLERQVAQVEQPDELDGLLLHESADGFNGTLVCVPQMNYGTRSSTLIELGGDRPRLMHAHGRPDQTDYSDFSDDLLRLIDR